MRLAFIALSRLRSSSSSMRVVEKTGGGAPLNILAFSVRNVHESLGETKDSNDSRKEENSISNFHETHSRSVSLREREFGKERSWQNIGQRN